MKNGRGWKGGVEGAGQLAGDGCDKIRRILLLLAHPSRVQSICPAGGPSSLRIWPPSRSRPGFIYPTKRRHGMAEADARTWWTDRWRSWYTFSRTSLRDCLVIYSLKSVLFLGMIWVFIRWKGSGWSTLKLKKILFISCYWFICFCRSSEPRTSIGQPQNVFNWYWRVSFNLHF